MIIEKNRENICSLVEYIFDIATKKIAKLKIKIIKVDKLLI
tara:strand:- start:166 stop:288 length:123 start_codon:yes stop_codon:yes gene_type:complete